MSERFPLNIEATKEQQEKYAQAIVVHATEEWQSVYSFNLDIPPRDKEPTRLLFERVKELGCEVRNNPDTHEWEVRKEQE